MGKRRDRRCRFAPLLLVACLVLPALVLPVPGRPALAHDLPGEMLLTGFIKPEGERLAFLIRVPLALFEGVGLPKRGPGYLDLARIDEALDRSALAVARELVLYENGERLAPGRAIVQVAQPSNDSFGSYDAARAHILGPPLPDTTNVFWNQGYLDLYLDFPITSEQSSFALDFRAAAGLAGRVKLDVRFLPPDGAPRSYEVHGGYGWLELDPSWSWVVWRFGELGFGQMLAGIDGLVFLLCLVLPFRLRQLRRLAVTVGAFAFAHSIALWAVSTGAVSGGDWLAPLIQALIALSILWLALENIVVAWLNRPDRGLRWRWLVAGAFGLPYGIGFAAALQPELQFAGAHFLPALLAFNLGLELGQLALLMVVVPALALLLRSVQAWRIGVVIVSTLIAHAGWHWLDERMVALRFVRWPELDVAGPSLLLALIAALVVVFAWLVAWQLWHRRRERQPITFGQARF